MISAELSFTTTRKGCALHVITFADIPRTPTQDSEGTPMLQDELSSPIEPKYEDEFLGFDGACDERSPNAHHTKISSMAGGIKNRKEVTTSAVRSFNQEPTSTNTRLEPHTSSSPSNLNYKSHLDPRDQYVEENIQLQTCLWGIVDEHAVKSTQKLSSQMKRALLLPKMLTSNEEPYPKGPISFKSPEPEFLSSDTSVETESQTTRDARIVKENEKLAGMERRSSRDMRRAKENNELWEMEREACTSMSRSSTSSINDSQWTNTYEENERPDVGTRAIKHGEDGEAVLEGTGPPDEAFTRTNKAASSLKEYGKKEGNTRWE